MRALAGKADYSPAALYKYFANKKELVAALRKEGHELADAIQRQHQRPGMSMAETFHAMSDSYLEFARTYPAYYELIMYPTEEIPENFAAFLNQPEFQGLIGFASGVVQSGQIRLPAGYQPIHLAFMMWFLANGAAILQNTAMRNCQAEFLQISSKVFDMVNQFILPEQK